MEDNRFVRAYQEYKREKEQTNHNYNNRFECLRETRPSPVIREGGGRFECLRGENYISYPNSQDTRVNGRDINDRFACLADDRYQSYPRQPPECVHYLPRPEPKESINSQMRRYQEEKRISIATKPPSPPKLSFDSNYHFPELGKTADVPTNSKIPKPIQEIKLPEPKPQKVMIVNPVVIPVKKETITVLMFNGKSVVSKEVYEDGTSIGESGPVMIKKPNYSSWASVLKPESTNTVYYDVEEEK